MQTTNILRSSAEHNAAGQKIYNPVIEEVYGRTMYPQYSQLSAEFEMPASGVEAGSGVVSPVQKKSVTTPTKRKNAASSRTSASMNPTAGGGTDTTGESTEMVYSDLNKTHALVGAVLGAVLAYAYKKDWRYGLGGAAIGYMGTNLYETKSIFG